MEVDLFDKELRELNGKIPGYSLISSRPFGIIEKDVVELTEEFCQWSLKRVEEMFRALFESA
jgi:hypothetical protein